MTHLSRLTSSFEIPGTIFFFHRAHKRAERFFDSQSHLSYLVATNAKDLGCVMSYLVATNAKILKTKDKDKCLTSRNKLGQGNRQPTAAIGWTDLPRLMRHTVVGIPKHVNGSYIYTIRHARKDMAPARDVAAGLRALPDIDAAHRAADALAAFRRSADTAAAR